MKSVQVLLLCLALACLTTGIRNGLEFADWSQNFLKYIVYLDGCSGSMASKDVVFTAAHCVCNKNKPIKFISPQILFKWESGKKYRIKSQHHNANFVQCWKPIMYPSGYDAAVLISNEPLPISKDLPVAIFSYKERPQPGRQVIMAGYGMNRGGDNDRLRYGYGVVVQKCDYLHFRATPVCVESIKKGEHERQHTRQGDSGGPLVDRADPTLVLGFLSGRYEFLEHGIIQKETVSAYASVLQNAEFLLSFL